MGQRRFFLWINLNAPNSDVINDFPDDGQQVTWYGGSRMHEGTPAIQRLLSVAKQQQLYTTGKSGSGKGGGIVLWCRRYIKERKAFEPYTCLGRLSYVSHTPHSRQLAFLWKLEDFESIQNHSDESRRRTFRSMVHG